MFDRSHTCIPTRHRWLHLLTSALQTGTHFMFTSEKIVFLSQLLNVTLKPSCSLSISTRVDSRRRLYTFCIHGWSSGAAYAALNHWRPCCCRRRSTCLEQSSSRSAPIPDIFYFQNTPEVTSVQHILLFSLTVSLTVFSKEPLKPLVLHTHLWICHHYIT